MSACSQFVATFLDIPCPTLKLWTFKDIWLPEFRSSSPISDVTDSRRYGGGGKLLVNLNDRKQHHYKS